MSVLVSALRQSSEERLTVLLDDGSEVKATLSVAARLRLFVGRALEDEELEELRSAAAESLARQRGMELLSYRPMSSKELLDKLLQKGEAPEAAESAVRWLAEQRFLDDGRYAGMVVRHYAGKGYGEGRIRQELRRRGIPRELWDEALGQMPWDNNKMDAYIASHLKDPGDREQVRKISAALYRRGFSWEDIRTALARFRAEVED